MPTNEEIKKTLDDLNRVLLESADKIEKQARELRYAATGMYLSIPSPFSLTQVAKEIELATNAYWDLQAKAREEAMAQRYGKESE